MNSEFKNYSFNIEKCTLCGSNRTISLFLDQFAYRGKRFYQWLCLDCGVWFSPASDETFVDNDDYLILLSKESAASINYRDELIKPYIKGKKKILEIGFGGGGVLAKVIKNHPESEIRGLDNSERLVKKANLDGLCCFSGTEKLDFKANFIYGHHVFEHFKHPDLFFHQSTPSTTSFLFFFNSGRGTFSATRL